MLTLFWLVVFLLNDAPPITEPDRQGWLIALIVCIVIDLLHTRKEIY